MKICFWGNVAGALSGKTDGGGELQIAFIAKALAEAGHEVIVVDYQVREEYVTPDGIRVFPIKDWHKGIRVFRMLTHRIPGLYSTLMDQKADIYYCRIRDFRHIIAFLVSRKVKGKFVLHMASDLDAMNFSKRVKNYYSAKSASLWWFFSGLLVEVVYPFLLRHADLVLVQHEGQKEILRKKNIPAVVFFNLIDLTKVPCSAQNVHDDFTYVGWLDNRKGFPDCFRLIEKAPTHTFKIIGPPRDKTGVYYYEKLKSFPNVRLMGHLKHSDTMKEIANSKALISTSPMEGFPNVFIEAWACGIPVISLNVDPGSVIAKEGLGVIANGDLNIMLKAMDNHINSNGFASRAKSYVNRNHALNALKKKEINELFSRLAGNKQS